MNKHKFKQMWTEILKEWECDLWYVKIIAGYAELNGLEEDVSFKYIWKDGIFEILWWFNYYHFWYYSKGVWWWCLTTELIGFVDFCNHMY